MATTRFSVALALRRALLLAPASPRRAPRRALSSSAAATSAQATADELNAELEFVFGAASSAPAGSRSDRGGSVGGGVGGVGGVGGGGGGGGGGGCDDYTQPRRPSGIDNEADEAEYLRQHAQPPRAFGRDESTDDDGDYVAPAESYVLREPEPDVGRRRPASRRVAAQHVHVHVHLGNLSPAALRALAERPLRVEVHAQWAAAAADAEAPRDDGNGGGGGGAGERME